MQQRKNISRDDVPPPIEDDLDAEVDDEDDEDNEDDESGLGEFEEDVNETHEE